MGQKIRGGTPARGPEVAQRTKEEEITPGNNTIALFAAAAILFLLGGCLPTLEEADTPEVAEEQPAGPQTEPDVPPQPVLAVEDVPGKYTVYVVPHSHIDVEWKWTYDEANKETKKILDAAINLMRQDERYCFTQGQVLALQPWWESLSVLERDFVRDMVREGRFEVVGGMYVMPEFVEPGGESTARQFLHGLPWMRREMGAKVRVGWNIDSFGQDRQLPQLYRQAGMDSFVFSRGGLLKSYETRPLTFEYEAPDGSKVLANWLAAHYSAYGVVGKVMEGLNYMRQCDRTRSRRMLLLWGTDMAVPQHNTAQIEAIVHEAAAKINMPLNRILITTPSRFFDDIRAGGVETPALRTDFNPPIRRMDLRGTVATRPRVKIEFRRAETALRSAEALIALAGMAGLKAPNEGLRNAWLDLLFNANHDTIAGSCIDPVYDACMKRFASIHKTAESLSRTALATLAQAVQADTENPLLVFNTLSFPRTEICRIPLFDQEDEPSYDVVDPKGKTVPSRIILGVGEERRSIEFLAKDVPAMGYVVYSMRPSKVPTPAILPYTAPPATGVSVIVAEDGKLDVALRGEDSSTKGWIAAEGGNDVVLEREKNPELEGILYLTGEFFRMSDFPVESANYREDALGRTWFLRGSFPGGPFEQEVSIPKGIDRVEFRTTLINYPGADGLMNVSFPLTMQKKDLNTHAETHFAVTSRPPGQPYACQTWVLAEDGRRGVAFLNRGSQGYWLRDDNVFRIQLLRSYLDYKGYPAPLTAEKGRHVFEYAVVPHGPDWREGRLVESAHSYNTPLLAVRIPAQAGLYPARHGFLEVKEGEFEVTALKKAEDGDGFVVRGYDTRGRGGQVRVQFGFKFKQAWRSDIMEAKGAELPLVDGAASFPCRPFEIVTLRVK